MIFTAEYATNRFCSGCFSLTSCFMKYLEIKPEMQWREGWMSKAVHFRARQFQNRTPKALPTAPLTPQVRLSASQSTSSANIPWHSFCSIIQHEDMSE